MSQVLKTPAEPAGVVDGDQASAQKWRTFDTHDYGPADHADMDGRFPGANYELEAADEDLAGEQESETQENRISVSLRGSARRNHSTT